MQNTCKCFSAVNNCQRYLLESTEPDAACYEFFIRIHLLISLALALNGEDKEGGSLSASHVCPGFFWSGGRSWVQSH